MVSRLLSKPYCLLHLYVLVALLGWEAFAALIPDQNVIKRQSSWSMAPLEDFQVTEPVTTPSGPGDQHGCYWTETLMEYQFANSYYKPFVGEHEPPPCNFNRVTMNFTVTSKGRQFDRLGIMYLGDVEVFRTSTAEPTAYGIVWTYTKEMDQYNALWETKQKIIFDLANVVDDTYTGVYNTSLVATFFSVPDSRSTADTILPISAQQSGSNKASAFSLPSDNATVSYKFPRNVEKAVISLSACGQIAEEFWYANVFSSDVNAFPSIAGELYGFGPFREVQLLIDGQLAGVSWPFPVIFTGGINPAFWRPIVGIEAFDLRQHEIDVTPWLPLLCDGASHSFEIRVVGLDDDGHSHATISESVGSFWVVTGTIFLFLGQNGTVTTGNQPRIDTPLPEISISSRIATNNYTGANENLTYTTSVNRRISISSFIQRSNSLELATWTQTLAYKSFGKLTGQGLVQYTEQNTTGSDVSASGYASTYSYPLTLKTSFSINSTGEVDLLATLDRGLNLNIDGPSVFPSGLESFNPSRPTYRPPPGSNSRLVDLRPLTPRFTGARLSTTQNGSAELFYGDNFTYGFGTTEQDFDFKGTVSDSSNLTSTYDLYHRHVLAEGGAVIEDEETPSTDNSTSRASRLLLGGAGGGVPLRSGPEDVSVRALLGRGPGQPKSGPPQG